MHALYYAEQAYLALSSVILTILFGCQLLEKRPGQQIGKLKALYHWLGFVGSVVLLVRSIDPRGFWGILDRWLIYSLLGNTCTSILLACTSAAVWFSLLSFTQVVLQGGQNKCTLAAGVVLKVSTVATFVVAYAVIVLQVVNDRRWFAGIFLIWLAGIFLMLGVIFNLVTLILNRAIGDLATGDNAGKLARAAREMRLFRLVGTIPVMIAVPFQIWQGVEIFKDGDRTIYSFTPETATFRDSILLILQILALCVCCWWSYLPLRCLSRVPCCAPAAPPISRAPSDERRARLLGSDTDEDGLPQSPSVLQHFDDPDPDAGHHHHGHTHRGQHGHAASGVGAHAAKSPTGGGLPRGKSALAEGHGEEEEDPDSIDGRSRAQPIAPGKGQIQGKEGDDSVPASPDAIRLNTVRVV